MLNKSPTSELEASCFVMTSLLHNDLDFQSKASLAVFSFEMLIRLNDAKNDKFTNRDEKSHDNFAIHFDFCERFQRSVDK